jgi:hypothetical protein
LGQFDHKTGPAPQVILTEYTSAVAQCDGLDQGQAQSNPAITLSGAWQAVKRLENALL